MLQLARTWIQKRSIGREVESLIPLYDAAREAFNSGDHEFQARVRLKIYHVFEELWRDYRVNTGATDLWLRYLYDCSDDKIRDIVVATQRELHRSAEVHSSAVGRAFLASSAGGYSIQRRFRGTPLESFAIDRTGRLFSAALDLAPTLQVDAWLGRFGEGEPRGRLHPLGW